MAGGMNRPGTPTPAFLRADYRELTAPLPTPEPVREVTHAHCWVLSPDSDDRQPGVLLAWAHEGGRWRGHIAYVVHDGQAPAVVVAWVDGEQLRPA